MEKIVEVHRLTKHFPLEQGFSSLFSRRRDVVHAVCEVDLAVRRGEILGLVGESGSGKSTLAMCILALIKATEGQILFKGQDITDLDSKKARLIRREMQVVFQDPYSSLNPRMKVRSLINMPMEIHNIGDEAYRRQRVSEILHDIGLSDEFADRYPHQLSGGQRQRIAIARALSASPEFIIADEPTSGLDVSVQAQILNLLLELQRRYGFSILFISHDLGVVEYLSDRVAVMYLGKVVEIGSTGAVMRNPLHPYTRALVSAFPIPDPTARREKYIVKGEVPSSINPPSGCRFRSRCPYAQKVCEEEPSFIDMSEDRFVACHFAGKV